MNPTHSSLMETGLPPLPSKRACPLDPPPEYRLLRAEQPICKVQTPRGDAAWLITKYDDIIAVLTDKRFSSDPRTPGFPTYVSGNVPPPPGFFMQADAPDHPRLRRSVTREFMASHVEELRPQMRKIVDATLDKMLAMTPPVDLMKTVATPVASRVICELLGVSLDDYPFVQSRTDIILNRDKTPQETEVAAIELMSYFDRIVTEKEKVPAADLLGRLITEAAREGQPSHQELVGLAALLLLAAYDTMALAMGLGVVVLLQHPDQLAAFLSEAVPGTRLVDELVRYVTINHSGLPRAATADVEVASQLIRKGDGVLVMLNSGNRDESAFHEPDAFNIHRPEYHHVGFGHGLHKCLGVHFAQAELQIFFHSLFQRVPSLCLARKVEELPFRHEMVLYGLKELPVSWSAEAKAPQDGPRP